MCQVIQARWSHIINCFILRLITTTYSSTCPQPLPKRVLQSGLSNPPSFSFHYPLLSLKSFSGCLRLLIRPFVTYILPSTCPSIACFERKFLRRMWPIQLAFLRVTLCRMFLFSLTLCNTSFLTRSAQLISILLQHHTQKRWSYS